MKDIVAGVVAAAMVLSTGAASICSAGRESGLNFVDADQNGVCDNYGTYCGNGVNYVDEDGDGVCDNYETYGGNRCGRNGGNAGGNGRGGGYGAGRCGRNR